MSESVSILASAAVVGAQYTDKGGHLVVFLGPSAKHANMLSMRVIDTQRVIDSVPPTYPLFPADPAVVAAKAAIASVKGAPRDVVVPKLRELDDDALDQLIADDSRMWVAEEVTRELDRRRVGLMAAILPLPEVQRALDTAPIGRVESAIVPPITIVSQGEITTEEIPLVVEADEAPPWLASSDTDADPDVVPEAQVPESGARSSSYMAGRAAFCAGRPVDAELLPDIDAEEWTRGWTEMRDLAISEPGFVKMEAPAPVATDSAPVVVKVRRPRGYEAKLGALGYPADVYEAMTPEAMRAILEADEPPRYVPPRVSRPGPARDARCPCCDRVIVDILGEAPTAVEVDGVWGCADCYDAHKWPLPIEQLVSASLPRALALVAAAPLGDLLLWTRAEASGPAREEVLDAIQARIADASDEEHEEADAASSRPSFLACPTCGAEVYWSCEAETGKRGSAHCSMSGLATRAFADGPPTCDWRGQVVRLDDGGVVLVELEVRPDPVSFVDAVEIPGQVEARMLRFLAERDVALDPGDLGVFRGLVGSVRECTAAIRATDARHILLLGAALAWATDNGAGATVLAMLEKRVRQLRGAPTTDARPATPGPAYRRTGGNVPEISEAGAARVEAIRAQLAKLSAALPGYVAAMEATAALREHGISVRYLFGDGAD